MENNSIETATNPHQRYIDECRMLGYEPTEAEISMHFRRNRLCNIVGFVPTNGLEIDEDQVAEVRKNLENWGKSEQIIGDPIKEFASNLYFSFGERLENILQDASNYTVVDSREARNALMCGDHLLPLENLTSFMAYKLDAVPKSEKIFGILTRPFQSHKVAVGLSFFYGKMGYLARHDIEKRYGDCIVSLIQTGSDERIKQTAIKLIQELNRFYRLDRYQDADEISSALDSVLKTIEPIKNSVIRALNVLLGPIQKK